MGIDRSRRTNLAHLATINYNHPSGHDVLFLQAISKVHSTNLTGAIAMTVYILLLPQFFPGISEASEAWDFLQYLMYGVCGIGFIGAILFVILFVILIIGFYAVLGIKTSGTVRKKSLFISFGFLLVYVGLILTQAPDIESNSANMCFDW